MSTQPKWYVTDAAIEDAARLLGYGDDPDDDEWDYLAQLLEGLSLVARGRKRLSPDLHSCRAGEAHHGFQFRVASPPNNGAQPRLIGVDAPSAAWTVPRTPLRLPIPTANDYAPDIPGPNVTGLRHTVISIAVRDRFLPHLEAEVEAATERWGRPISRDDILDEILRQHYLRGPGQAFRKETS